MICDFHHGLTHEFWHRYTVDIWTIKWNKFSSFRILSHSSLSVAIHKVSKIILKFKSQLNQITLKQSLVSPAQIAALWKVIRERLWPRMEPRGIVLLVGHQCRTSNQELNKLEAYSKSCETSKMDPFLKIVNGF